MDNAAMGVPAGAPPAPAAPTPAPAPATMPGDPAAMGAAPMPGADPTAMAAAAPMPGDPAVMGAAPAPGADPMAAQGNGFDMGIGMTPEEDPKKWIEGAAAKLAGELRKYQEGQPKPDMELNKTAVNTIAAATKAGIQPNQKDELMSSYADAMRREGDDGSDGSGEMQDNMGGEDPIAGGDMGSDPNAMAGGDMGADPNADPNAAGGDEQVPLQETINKFVNELFQNLKNDKRDNSSKSEIEYQKDRKSFSRKPFTPPIK